jgi:uncharacterized membrane protein HdeD (DUF308 family)
MEDQLEYNKNSSKSIRISQIVLGIIAIALSLAIIVNPGVGVVTLVTLLSITLFVAGLERVVVGVFSNLKKSSRIGNIVLGAITIGLGVGVMAFPLMTTIFLVTLLAIGLLFLGAARIIQGISNKNISKWSRASLVGVGIFSLAISSIVLIDPVAGVILLTLLLAINLLIIGAESVVHGISGRRNFAKSSTATVSYGK